MKTYIVSGNSQKQNGILFVVDAEDEIAALTKVAAMAHSKLWFVSVMELVKDTNLYSAITW